jgi:hypothetical protein
MVLAAGLCFLAALCERSVCAEDAIEIGSRRELLVDDTLIQRLSGNASLQLHHPVPREIAVATDEPWEGNGTNYLTVFQDGDRYRMYYRGAHFSYTPGQGRPTHRDVYCYAESADGIHWTKPELGLFEWEGSKKNNIVWDGVGAHGFVPFKDPNPACAPEAAYKALGVGSEMNGLYAFQSADGIHWSLMNPEPVITKGAFDSQNVGFWDAERGEYREYHRDFRDGRDIRTSTSKDFIHWTEPDWISYRALVNPGQADPSGKAAPEVQDPSAAKYPSGRVSELYTNQISPYFRAPHILLGFPTRYIDRGWTEATKALPRLDFRQTRSKQSQREGTAVTEGMFMTGRDRQQFNVWPEAFLRPGLRTRDTWFYGDLYQCWGLLQTKSEIEDALPELSMFVTERTGQEEGARVRRYTLRIDGFVSASSPLVGGELLTKPLVFSGSRLRLNYSSSAAGSIGVELQEPDGSPVPGFSLDDCDVLFGDSLDQVVSWKGQSDVGRLAGRTVRLRITLSDADLYALQFCDAASR